AVSHYVADASERHRMLTRLPEIESHTRSVMRESVAANAATPFSQIVRRVIGEMDGFSSDAKDQLFAVIDKIPAAYQKAKAIFATPEKRSGVGGVFAIFVSDLCKGCAACVTA